MSTLLNIRFSLCKDFINLKTTYRFESAHFLRTPFVWEGSRGASPVKERSFWGPENFKGKVTFSGENHRPHLSYECLLLFNLPLKRAEACASLGWLNETAQ